MARPRAKPKSEAELSDEKFEEQLKANKILLARRKTQYAQATQAGEEPPIADLNAIVKLEQTIVNLEQYLRLRKRHRQRLA